MAATLLRDARLIGAGDATHDVLLDEGRIVTVGSAGSVHAPGAEPVALDGRHLGPGLWDAHVHFTQHVIRRRRLDLGGTGSAAEVLDLVRTRLAAGGVDDVLFGYGFRDGTWAVPPSLQAIDAVTGEQAVVLISGDLHCAWLNSAAARRFGVTPDETGLLRETAWIDLSHGMNVGADLPVSAFNEAAQAAAARGVVGVVEYEGTDNVAEWTARVAAGVDQLRVDVAVWPELLEAAVAAGHRTGDVLDPRGLVRFGTLKVVADGSLNTRTAWCHDPYPGLDPHAEHACGVNSVPMDELRRLLRRAHGAGIDAAVHAIGDRANTEVLDAFAEVGIGGVIEHAQLVSDADFARFAQLGLAASVQPEHAMDDRDVADLYWPGRTGRAFALASLHAAGAQLRLGSDAPVAPLDPWMAIAAATARSRGDRDPWHPEQRIPFDVAYAASTRGRTAVVPGDVADLVVMDADPSTADRDALRALPVSATLVAGRFTHREL